MYWLVIKDIVLIVVSVFLFVFAVVFGISEYGCYGYSKATGKETKASGLGCYVNTGNEWMSIKEYRFVIMAREGLRELSK